MKRKQKRQEKSKSNRKQTNKNNKKKPTIVTKIPFQLPYDIQATLSIQRYQLEFSRVRILVIIVCSKVGCSLRKIFGNVYEIFHKCCYVSLLVTLNALTAVGALMTLIDFTLSNARRFYSSMGNPLAVKGLRNVHKFIFGQKKKMIPWWVCHLLQSHSTASNLSFFVFVCLFFFFAFKLTMFALQILWYY